MSSTYSVVQFVHPGFEYRQRKYVGSRNIRSGVMPWKEGRSRHDRKFILTRGAAFDWTTGEDHAPADLTLWGEWEGPSVFWKLESPGYPLPSILHAPFRPDAAPTTSVQNTDPMVFGETFIYSNCRQRRHPILRALPSGSIILFGRLSREEGKASFSLDTCFVVDEVNKLPPVPFGAEGYGEDLVYDAALCPLHTEGGEGDLGVHLGRSRNGDGPFSFFPAQPVSDEVPLFARPEILPVGVLERAISPGTQAVKITRGLNESERDAIWAEVAEQVARQECMLGYFAAAPPLLDQQAAEEATSAAPRPLT